MQQLHCQSKKLSRTEEALVNANERVVRLRHIAEEGFPVIKLNFHKLNPKMPCPRYKFAAKIKKMLTVL